MIEMRSSSAGAGEVRAGDRVVEVTDERHPLAAEALQLIADSFPPHDRHPMAELRSEIAEKRLELLTAYDFHLLALVGEDGQVVAANAGVYLAGVNAGFISYLAVHPDVRGRRLGRRVRTELVKVFRADARRNGRDELAWVLGEIRIDSPWLRGLVRHGGAIPFDLTYYHPGMTPGVTRVPYVLYREPIGDHRAELPAQEVRRIIYAIWRRAYRVRYPLERDGFAAMIRELEGREWVSAHPEVMGA
jgi:GNAT superfamily N-acetyltransferase